MSSDYHHLLPKSEASGSTDDLEKDLDELLDSESAPPARYTLRRPLEFGILIALLLINVIGLYLNYWRPNHDCSASSLDPIWGVSGPLYCESHFVLIIRVC